MFYTNVSRGRGGIFYRGFDDKGNRVEKTVKFKPVLYTPTNKETEFKTIYGEPLEERVFENMYEAGKFLRTYEGVEGFSIFGQKNFANQFIQRVFPDTVDFDFSKIVCGKFDIETTCENGFPDIEQATEEIICATLYENRHCVYHVFYLTPRGEMDMAYFEDALEAGLKIEFHGFEDEKSMLMGILRIWKQCDMDIVSGWYSDSFDIPFFINRLYRVFPEGRDFVNSYISPSGDVRSKEIKGEKGKRDYKTYTFGGLEHIDLMDAYKKFIPEKQEAYNLAHIGSVEVGETKMSHEEYAAFHLFYKENYPKFVAYNFKDVYLLNRIDEKTKLIEFMVTIAYMAKVNYTDVFSSMRTIESLCFDYLYNKGIVIKVKGGSGNKNEKYKGAFVKEPQRGMFDWVVSFDVNSLYPTLIRQLNISPETLRPELFGKNGLTITIDSLMDDPPDLSYAKNENVTVAANGQHFTREKEGFLPAIIAMLIDGRKAVKKQMIDLQKKLTLGSFSEAERTSLEYEISALDMKQLALKTLANSIYGVCGNPYFSFYDIRLAEAITKSGQYAIKFIEREMNKFLNTVIGTKDIDYILASDTDSLYLNMGPIVKKFRPDEKDLNKIVDFIDGVCKKKIDVWIDSNFAKMAEYTNAYGNFMVMKREVIASRGVWKAKKMYALRVFDSEGVRYQKPKLKIMGLETKRSDRPMWCRQKLSDAIDILLKGTEEEVQNFINQIWEDYKNMTPEDIAFPKGVNDIEKWVNYDFTTKSGTPAHVKAANNYNKILKEKKAENLYRTIQSGDKMKYVHLRIPNPYKVETMGFSSMIPKEFGVGEYVDYRLMFDKSIMEPMRNLLGPVGWEPEEVGTLEGFFG